MKKIPLNKEKDDLTQTNKACARLYSLLNTICESVNIRLDEWDVDKELLVAIISSPKSKTAKQAFENYDECYLFVKSLDISIPSKYSWFINIQKHVQ